MAFRLIIFALPILTLLWWWVMDRVLRGMQRPRPWRIALAAFALLQVALYAAVILGRRTALAGAFPTPVLAVAYLWNLFVLPLTWLGLIAGQSGYAAFSLIRIYRRLKKDDAPMTREEALEKLSAPQPAPETSPAEESGPALTRRDFLRVSAAYTPPLILTAATGRGMLQLDDFRIRRMDVPVPGLPVALDGLTITHLSDTHVGPYTTPRTLSLVAEATSKLKPDLIAFTGDLINSSLRELPDGLAMLKELHAPGGVFLCEGNHDLFENRAAFEKGVAGSGNVEMLINRGMTTNLRGAPVQVLGLRWGIPGAGRGAALEENMKALLDSAPLQTGAFPILLAHHPHAFDLAKKAGIPLTLSGHTHGGQLMLTDDLGPGPAMYKYWSGLYREDGHAAVVSNGTGNWFPLRINAPAEIIHLTLRRA